MARPEFRLTLLGAGTPTPTPERFGSAEVIRIGDERLMFDCGPAATDKLVKAGIAPTQVNHLFFTHHHFDHDVDYPCFLLCRWDQGAGLERTLQVYGPGPTARLTEALIGAGGAFEHDWQARINFPTSQAVFVRRGGTLPRRPPRVDATDIVAGWTAETDHWRITTALAEHVQPWLDSLAYRVETDAGSVVLTGDTQPCPTVLELARGADTLVSMCWDDDETMRQHGEDLAQTGIVGAATMARDAGVRRLVLTHMGPHISTPAVLEHWLARVRPIFDGEIVVGRELASVGLGR